MRFLRYNGLTLAFATLFVGTVIGQFFTGLRSYNNDNAEHSRPTVSAVEYCTTGHLWEALAENWESEFLQMSMYVVLCSFLYQKGSPESNDPDQPNDCEADPAEHKNDHKAPWPVRRGGWILRLYSNSLGLALGALFLVSFFVHAAGGHCLYNDEQKAHGQPAISVMQFMVTSQFWFESLQNWQSEFLSLALMILMGVYLRQRDSSQSKPVAAPHDQTE